MSKKMVRCITLLSLCHCTIAAQALDLYQAQQAHAAAIYQRMTLDEKIGQLLLPNYMLLADSAAGCPAAVANPAATTAQLSSACGLTQIAQYHIGAVLMGGGPYFDTPTLAHFTKLNALAADQHRLGSPQDPLLLTGNDAVHGNSHLQGAVIFPHNIGLGVTHNAELVRRIAVLVGQDSLASGFNWVYAPTLAVAQDLRWGRSYESFGQQPSLVKNLGRAAVSGLQNIHQGAITGPIATAKHFIGDGATQYGFDEGDDAYTGSQQAFWHIHGQGYEGALQAHVATIMTSYSAIDDAHSGNDTQMHFGGKWNLVNRLKTTGINGSDGRRYRFSGFVVSDWNGATRAAFFYSLLHPTLSLPEILAKSINAGVDMLMLGASEVRNPFNPHSELLFRTTGDVFVALKTAYQQGLISPARLHDAVTRILAVKLALQPQTPQDYTQLQADERALAYQAATQSLVLLKNTHATLPLDRHKIRHIIFIGPSDDLGLQNGGWTVNWQGQKGNAYFSSPEDQISSGALTLEQGLKRALPQAQVYHLEDRPSEALTADNSVVIATVAEVPYAEYMGDIGNSEALDLWYQQGGASQTNTYLGLPQNTFLGLHFDTAAATAIQQWRARGIPIVTVVYSGRPLVLSDGGLTAPLTQSDALIAAFLPGTLGGKALSAALLGDYRFRSVGSANTLSFPWPATMAQVTEHFVNGALFPIGYGLAD